MVGVCSRNWADVGNDDGNSTGLLYIYGIKACCRRRTIRGVKPVPIRFPSVKGLDRLDPEETPVRHKPVPTDREVRLDSWHQRERRGTQDPQGRPGAGREPMDPRGQRVRLDFLVLRARLGSLRL